MGQVVPFPHRGGHGSVEVRADDHQAGVASDRNDGAASVGAAPLWLAWNRLGAALVGLGLADSGSEPPAVANRYDLSGFSGFARMSGRGSVWSRFEVSGRVVIAPDKTALGALTRIRDYERDGVSLLPPARHELTKQIVTGTDVLTVWVRSNLAADVSFMLYRPDVLVNGAYPGNVVADEQRMLTLAQIIAGPQPPGGRRGVPLAA